jgi:hypothetical protein
MSETEKVTSVSASAFGVGVLRPGTVQVTVGKQVNKKNLHDIIDRIFDQHGCLGCGLGGLDVHIRAQDPTIIDRFQDIPEVKDVTVIR